MNSIEHEKPTVLLINALAIMRGKKAKYTIQFLLSFYSGNNAVLCEIRNLEPETRELFWRTCKEYTDNPKDWIKNYRGFCRNLQKSIVT
ncbi:MAG: hypothetical protein HN826_02490 [Methylococcales bacterium]|mgnify:CR=1 FL=1|jgi:hypothetical protein|nr:hypothetical protein [Methylococcales bacterium]